MDKYQDLRPAYREDGCYIADILSFKRNYIINHKEVLGVQFGEYKKPFQFVSELEIKNKKKFYLEDNDIPKNFEKLESKLYFKEEKKILFSKNDMILWFIGSRGTMADVYSLFDIHRLAIKRLLELKKKKELPEEYLMEGKIDRSRALPVYKKIIAGEIFTEDEIKVIEKVKYIDLDGVDDIDSKLADLTLFRRIKYDDPKKV